MAGFVGIFITAIVAGYFGSKNVASYHCSDEFLRDLRKNYQQVLDRFFCGFFVATFILFFGNQVMGSGKELMEKDCFSPQINGRIF